MWALKSGDDDGGTGKLSFRVGVAGRAKTGAGFAGGLLLASVPKVPAPRGEGFFLALAPTGSPSARRFTPRGPLELEFPLPVAVVAIVQQLLEAQLSAAATFPIYSRPNHNVPSRFSKRLDMSGSFGNGSSALTNKGDSSYYCNSTLGGSPFSVLIDTGRYAILSASIIYALLLSFCLTYYFLYRKLYHASLSRL